MNKSSDRGGRTVRGLLLAGAAVAALAAGVGLASAAGFFTNGVPPAGGTQYPTTFPLTGAETLPADTNLAGGANPQSEAVTPGQIVAFGAGQAGTSGQRNALVGGDFGTNPWQRGTGTSGNIANVATYWADQWWNLGGASSSINVSKQTGASDITSAYQASARFQRTASNADTTEICTGQVLETVNSVRFQGQTVEFDVHMLAGANFSSASSNVKLVVASGTGSDQSATLFAAGTWTGFANAVSLQVPISTTWTRYTVVAAIPVTATQIGVKLCYTPVGTAGANDWVEFTGAQLAVNPNLASYAGTQLATTTGAALSFERRHSEIELALAERYFWQINETNGGQFGTGMFASTNVPRVVFPTPVQMRAVPTVAVVVGGFSFRISGANAAATGGGFAADGSTAQTVNSIAVVCTNTGTVNNATQLVGTATTGKITASAEL